MNRAAVLLLLAGYWCSAQMRVDSARVRPVLHLFEPQPGETTMHCEVTPVKPSLNFSFRFQAGYRVELPGKLFEGKGHSWTLLMRITPRAEDAKPVYLVSSRSLPEIPKTTVNLAFGGSYVVGEGTYDVSWFLVDDRSRVCRKTWRVDVHRGHSERLVKVAVPANTVLDVSLRGARLEAPERDDAAPLRMTVLLNAAPLYQRRTRLRGGDIGTLLSALSSLLERVPTRDVRLVVFNLEQQKELYRNGNFTLRNMPAVAESMNGIELNTVDYQVLKNRRGHVSLLAGLLNQELEAEPQSDVVLFIGPVSRYYDRVPSELLHPPSGPSPRFLNLKIIPLMLPPAALPDVIQNAISRVGGKTVPVHSPGEFAKAIARLEKPEGRR
jgi:hypothetical protein